MLRETITYHGMAHLSPDNVLEVFVCKNASYALAWQQYYEYVLGKAAKTYSFDADDYLPLSEIEAVMPPGGIVAMTKKERLFNHGSNCRVLKLDGEAAEKILEDSYYPDSDASAVMTPDEWDSFWEGYYNGTSTELVKLT